MSVVRKQLAAVVGAAMLLGAGSALAQNAPAGYPADYNKIVEAAKSEGAVSIYTSTDLSQAQALVDAFEKKYPGVKVQYNDLGSNGVYNRIISEAAANQVGADLAWSSAMDLQMKLATGNYFQSYASPEKANMPKWAVYKDTLYATSLEPIGMVYNTKALKENEVPKTRAELIAFLKKPEVKGKVATFDPEKSGTGFLFHTNDVRTTDNFWDIAKAFGQANGKTYSSTGAMKETVVSGENVLAFNVIGSYAMDWAKENNNLGAAFFTDNNAAFSRLIAIAKGAPHPNAAKLFLDFSLSKDGQSALASKGLPSVRTDVETGLNAKTLEEKVGGKVTPIAVDEGLVEYMDPQKRLGFFREWKSAISQ